MTPDRRGTLRSADELTEAITRRPREEQVAAEWPK